MSHDQEHNHDPEAARRGYIAGNDHSIPYISKWSRQVAGDDAAWDGAAQHPLRHLACSYLSTTGQPPTLLALKQHAQSLAVAISMLNPSLKPVAGQVDNLAEGSGRVIEQGDALDWLRSLTEAYDNADPLHHRPLTAMLNEVAGHEDVLGCQYHCPLADCDPPRDPDLDREMAGGGPALVKPYASHHNLLMHANACLERLDHELSAQGGLMAILPQQVPHEAEELRAARNTLLGQLLIFLQTLVGRMHELELHNGNMADIIAKMAEAPRQSLTAAGPDGRTVGVPIAYPQDRWILVNAGDDALNYVHDQLDRAESLVAVREKAYRDLGVVGDRPWDANDQDSFERGIVHINLDTRYYRIKGRTQLGENGRGTIFVLPAYGDHPGVGHTRLLEERPTVVSVPNPQFPPRASMLQERYDEKIKAGAAAREENVRLRERCETLKADVRSLTDEMRRLRTLNQNLTGTVDADKHSLNLDVMELRAAAREREREHGSAIAELTEELSQVKEKLERGQRRGRIPNTRRKGWVRVGSP